MSNYLCKDCTHNNHGWCETRKIQGLKKISVCEDFANCPPISLQRKMDDVELEKAYRDMLNRRYGIND